jgi:hypothetical protein
MWCVAKDCSSSELEGLHVAREIPKQRESVPHLQGPIHRLSCALLAAKDGWSKVQPLTMPSHMTSMMIEESM